MLFLLMSLLPKYLDETTLFPLVCRIYTLDVSRAFHEELLYAHNLVTGCRQETRQRRKLSPVMKLPRRNVGKLALFLVILTIGLTSPLLTMLSTLLLPKAAADPVLLSYIISLLLCQHEWRAFPYLMRQLARERLNVGIMVVVACETALEITLEYCKERTAFGQPISSFQNSRSG
jgi:Acyl-CoA dehydrogenase, C-terminal domain